MKEFQMAREAQKAILMSLFPRKMFFPAVTIHSVFVVNEIVERNVSPALTATEVFIEFEDIVETRFYIARAYSGSGVMRTRGKYDIARLYLRKSRIRQNIGTLLF